MNPTAAVRALPSRAALSDSVYDALRASIVDGGYGPDEPVRIDVVARELEVSQTPVREALARLEATGLVVRAALRGLEGPLVDFPHTRQSPAPEMVRNLLHELAASAES